MYWNPEIGIQQEGFGGAKSTGAFPSMGTLVHEMGHAVLFHAFGGADKLDRLNFFADEEQMIIDRLEAPAMRQLGFGYRTRHNTSPSRNDFINVNKQRLDDPRMKNVPLIGTYHIYSKTPISLQ